MFPFRRLLVALSGRDTDCGLLRYAAMLQHMLAGAEILCLHVAGEDDSPHLRRNVAAGVAEILPVALSEVVAGDVLDSILTVASLRPDSARPFVRTAPPFLGAPPEHEGAVFGMDRTRPGAAIHHARTGPIRFLAHLGG